MPFTIMHRMGDMDVDPPIESLEDLLKELEIEDEEHPDVSVRHDETQWCLSAFPGGLLIWGNVEDEDGHARHLKNVPREKVLELWTKLTKGELSSINSEPWINGYP
jgi:hypothetical protein